VSWIRDQGPADYDPLIEKTLKIIEEQESNSETRTSGAGSANTDDYDPLYDQAVNLVLEKGHASTSMVQRVFRIGYNRAARILEMMEKEGLVGPADGSKKREVLVGNL
jgi:S-DNA-T family DNA segregation ATPase FtsK/SpoIIIE